MSRLRTYSGQRGHNAMVAGAGFVKANEEFQIFEKSETPTSLLLTSPQSGQHHLYENLNSNFYSVMFLNKIKHAISMNILNFQQGKSTSVMARFDEDFIYKMTLAKTIWETEMQLQEQPS
ncbi:unnamed protein product [Dovyalis caffra]|uniref:Uncharacterized protein n=1 Tax=Dovyalis caffra TaxID=77055 RepID=A0AAV1RTF2_9ROSI|nr:unnamed protein product [Dovyalis caffra]